MSDSPVEGRAAPRRRRIRAALAVALWCLASGLPAAAHEVRPDQVIARLGSEPLRQRYGIVEVSRDPRLERLLRIRVDARWQSLEPELRSRAAEEWRQLWRASTSDGIVAIIDAGGASLVGFDARGRAHPRSP